MPPRDFNWNRPLPFDDSEWVRKADVIPLVQAVQAIFHEPQGCSLCDAGVPRNSEKGHQPDCPYYLAQQAMEKLTGIKYG